MSNKLSAAIVLVLLVVFFAPLAYGEIIETSTGWQEEPIIEGFLSNDFAINGIVEEELNRLVAKISQKLGKEKAYVNLAVEGLTDEKGDVSTNAELGEKRAKNALHHLSSRLPEGTRVSISKGSSMDKRGIKVRWEIQQLTPVKNNSIWQSDWLKIVVPVAFMVAIAFAISIKHNRKPDGSEQQKVVVVSIQNGYWPKDLDQLAMAINDKGMKDEEFFCPFCKEQTKHNVSVCWVNLKTHIAKSCCTKDGDVRETIFKKIGQYAA